MILPKGALEDLVGVAVGERLQGLRPVAVDLAARRLRAHAAVPADLLHIAIELDAVAVGVERESGIVDAGIELGRDVDEPDAVLFEEPHRLAQLRVAAELDAERGAARILGKAKDAAQFLRVEREA